METAVYYRIIFFWFAHVGGYWTIIKTAVKYT